MRIAGFNIHRGCLALRTAAGDADARSHRRRPLSRVLVLEGVNNPDNVGGLFRSAAAFGVELVVLGPAAAIRCIARRSARRWPPRWSCRSCSAPQWPGAIADLARRRIHGGRADAVATAAPLRGHSAPVAKLALLVGAEGDGADARPHGSGRRCAPASR